MDPKKLDLTCVSSTKLGLFGSFYFIGFAISSAIIPPISDKYGRKIIYLLSLMTQCYMQAVIVYVTTSVNVMIALYLGVGLAAGGKVVVGTNYLSEFVPDEYNSIAVLTIFIFESCTMMIQGVFYYSNRNWRPLHQGLFIWACVITLLISILPESPKFLYANHQYDRSR